MRDIIAKIIRNPEQYEAEYRLQCDNLKKFKDQLTIESVTNDLKNQMNALNN